MKSNREHEKRSDNAWHRLDNSANVFPLVSSSAISNVFRVSVQLNELVNPEVLQKAFEQTIPWFSHFKFRLRRGFFWNYFENNKATMNPVIEEEGRPCSYINPAANAHYMFRVLYYKNRISLEVFHALTDGTGAMQLLKALVINYLRLLKDEMIIMDSQVADVLSDTEDSYKKYSKKLKIAKDKLQSGYHMKGSKLPLYEMGIIHGYLDLPETLAYCKNKGISLTVYLAAVYGYAIHKAEQIERGSKPIQIAVPVNLRRYFDSNSTLNFFTHITVTLDIDKDVWDFDSVLESVKIQFKDQIAKEKFSDKIAANVATRRNPFIRFLPLIIKNIFVKIIYLSSMRVYTSTMSNVGQILVPKEYVSEIKHFEFFLNPTVNDPVKLAICSFESVLVLTMTSQLVRTDVQKEFYRKLSADGLSVRLESNGVYNEIL